jgi:hypothetical protein
MSLIADAGTTTGGQGLSRGQRAVGKGSDSAGRFYKLSVCNETLELDAPTKGIEV